MVGPATLDGPVVRACRPPEVGSWAEYRLVARSGIVAAVVHDHHVGDARLAPDVSEKLVGHLVVSVDGNDHEYPTVGLVVVDASDRTGRTGVCGKLK